MFVEFPPLFPPQFQDNIIYIRLILSKRFYDAATDPSLWKDFEISHRSLDDKIKVLQLPRCKKLKTLKLTESDGGVNNEILQILMKIDLEKLQLMKVNLESIDKVLLLDVFSKTKAVYLNCTCKLRTRSSQHDHEKDPRKWFKGVNASRSEIFWSCCKDSSRSH